MTPEDKNTDEYWQDRLEKAAYRDIRKFWPQCEVLQVAKEYAQHVIESRLPSEDAITAMINDRTDWVRDEIPMLYKSDVEEIIQGVISKLKQP